MLPDLALVGAWPRRQQLQESRPYCIWGVRQGGRKLGDNVTAMGEAPAQRLAYHRWALQTRVHVSDVPLASFFHDELVQHRTGTH